MQRPRIAKGYAVFLLRTGKRASDARPYGAWGGICEPSHPYTGEPFGCTNPSLPCIGEVARRKP